MPSMGEKARRAWSESKQLLEMALEIQKEGLALAQSRAERDYCRFMDTLRRRKD